MNHKERKRREHNMASMNVGGFVTTLVSVLVGAVILGAMLTIFAGITVPEGFANGDAIESMISLIPLICAVGLRLGAIFYFIRK